MKKLMIALSLAAVFSGSVMADELELDLDVTTPAVNYNLVPVTNGNINFSGSIYSKTCSIKGDKGIKNIQLKEVSNEDFSKVAYGTAGKTDFDIELENCNIPQNKLVTLKFNPSADSVKEGFLVNQAKGQKSNVLIRLNDEKGNKIDLQSEQETAPISVGTDVGTVKPISLNGAGLMAYKFSVEYAKDNLNHITPGAVQATLPFTIVYK